MKKKRKIIIRVFSQQKGFFASLAKRLDQEHDVRLVTIDINCEILLRKLLPDLGEKIVNLSGFSYEVDEAQIIPQCMAVEEKYGVRFSMMAAQDRALGRGYLLNVDRYPAIARASWPCERKCRELLEQFRYAEHIVECFSPDMVIDLIPFPVSYAVFIHHGILNIGIATARIGTRQQWIDNPGMGNEAMVERVRKHIENPASLSEQLPFDMKQDVWAQAEHSRTDYTFLRACTQSLNILRRALREFVLSRRKQASYHPLGWVPSRFRRWSSYHYVAKHGVTPDRLEGKRIVYFPLHLEPEVALLWASNEFTNSLEAISWISKSLPADVRLVVREHSTSFGVRSRWYYETLRQMPNVLLADPKIHSWDWIKASTFVATIAGTVAHEAVLFGRPALVFNRFHPVEGLPSVRIAESFRDTERAVGELLAMPTATPELDLSRRALAAAIEETSFELPGFPESYAGKELVPEMAERAVARLYEKYPEEFSVPMPDTGNAEDSSARESV